MRKIFALTLAALLATHAWAQDDTNTDQAETQDAQAEAAPADGNAKSTTRAATPQEITKAVHGSWQIRCVTVEPQQCFLYQLIVNDQNAPLLEYSLVPANDETGQDVKLVATMITPLNTVLERGIFLQIDEKDPVQKAYNWCAPIGCFARYGVTGAEIDNYKAGSNLAAVIFMMQNPGQGLTIELPLDGFGDAYDELMEIEAEQKG